MNINNLSTFAEAVAAVTPCTCSAQRDRAERAEAAIDACRAQVLGWERRYRMGEKSTKVDLFWAANAIRSALGAYMADDE